MNVQRFLSKRQKYSPKTRETYRLILSKFDEWASSRGLSPENLQPEQFDEYLPQAAPAYRRLILTCVKSYLKTMGYPDAPILGMDSIAAPPPVEMRTLSKDEIETVYRYLTARLGRRSYRRTLAMILLSLDGGLRATEICNLQLAAVDLDNATATVLRKGGRKVTTLPFSPVTAAAIRGYLKVRPEGGDLLFLSDEGRPIERNGWRLCLLRLARATGVKHFSPHALRRSGAVEWTAAGAPSEIVMRVFGWSDAALLSRYTMGLQIERARQWLPTTGLAVSAEVER